MNVCEKEELPCFLYLIQIFAIHKGTFSEQTHLKNENVHKKIRGHFKNKRNLSLEKFIGLLSVLLIDHNRSVSNNELPMITLPIAEFENKSQKREDYAGFGLANIDEQNEDSVEMQYEPEAQDLKLIISLGHFLSITNSLTINTSAISKQGLVVSCPFLGKQLFTTHIDLSRRLSDLNVYMQRREKALNQALLVQYKTSVDESVPQHIEEKVSY